jgi:hypothetical protein
MKGFTRFLFLLLLACSAAWGQAPAQEGFRALHVDAGTVIGAIHSFQGVNGTPAPVMISSRNIKSCASTWFAPTM